MAILQLFRPARWLTLPSPSGYNKLISFFEIREISDSKLKVSRRRRNLQRQQEQQKLQRGLSDDTSYLVSYYFSNVCPVISCFDSPTNIFRRELPSLIRASETISLCIQAIATARLSQYEPSRIEAKIPLRNRALKSLSTDIGRLTEKGGHVDETLILASVMLGMSVPWHNRTLGDEHFAGARSLVLAWLANTKKHHSPTPLTQLILPMLVYWEMLASFVMPDSAGIIEPLRSQHPNIECLISGKESEREGKAKLHPFTGAPTEIFELVAKVGHLVRTKTNTFLSLGETLDSRASHNGPEVRKSFSENLQWSAMVEECEAALLAYQVPSLEEVDDTNDSKTPVVDLLNIAEAYRYAALLQIYRACPDLLEMRLPVVQGTAQSADIDSEAAADEFLYGLAAETLECIAKISPNSGTHIVQPLILVMAANELRLSKPKVGDAERHKAGYRECEDWRDFLWARLASCIANFRSTPIAITLDVVKEMWAKIDDGQRVFWLEIILDNGWETLLG
ncbi:fungal-specific transcription factor domain-containing protein [Exophiala viscosa]|uniref:fungal-specific transcription factor domain-containing protein n=1 Tax=Exophiala viscosa TaxID=2486360 RepID=UPI002197EE59|nr:fungal-specific transcription factor domain-containing protein [Exophiala viscosa]